MKKEWRFFCRVLLLIVLLCGFTGTVFWLSLPNTIAERETITTSIFATLITILLSLLALTITAFVFLSTSLKEGREPFEQETIRGFLNKRTNQLLWLAGVGILCLLCCVFLDNTNVPLFQMPVFIIIVTTISFVENVLLLLYIWHIIKYERDLKKFAKNSRKRLYSKESGHQTPKITYSIYKSIGDLELLVNQLLHNHKDNYHYEDRHNILKTIFKTEDLVKRYERLISYRDFLLVEHLDNADSECVVAVYDDIKELENNLRKKLMVSEQFKSLGFTAPFLKLGDEKLLLQATVFTGASFDAVDLSGADLTGADFSQTRLNHLNLSGANCKETIFSDSVWKDIIINENSIFNKAVFRRADLGRQQFLAGHDNVISFISSNFDMANLLECVFSRIDLRFSSFHNALLANSVIDTVCISYANFNSAILTSVDLNFIQEENYPFSPSKYWQDSQLESDRETPLQGYENNWNNHNMGPAFFVNFEKAVLSQAHFSNYNFTGSRIAKANMSDARIEYCIFDRCFGQQVTFQEATIINCRFAFAILNYSDYSHAQIKNCNFANVGLLGCLMIQTIISSDEKGCSFQRANFTNSQLRGCTISNCDFTNAIFSDADLTGTCFRECNFTGAKFEGAYLDLAEFINCVNAPHMNSEELEKERYIVARDSMSTESAIFARRSTRSFKKGAEIDYEKLQKILCAALQAPSPKNRQPWHFTIVTDIECKSKLASILMNKLDELQKEREIRKVDFGDIEMARGSAQIMQDASVLVFVTYNRNDDNEHGDKHDWPLSAQPFEVGDLQSIGASIENMLLDAVSEGVDSLWMCDVLYAYQEFMDELNLQQPLVAAVALGYRTHRIAPRKPIEECVTFWKQKGKQSQ